MTNAYGDDVALVTVSYYSQKELQELLTSLECAASAPDAVVVVNNAADDPLSSLRERSDVRTVDAGRNLGYGAAVNLGVRDLPAQIGWICVANPDVRIDPSTISELLAAAATRPKGGAFGPRIIGDDGATYPSARAFPRLATGIGHALLGHRFPNNPWTRRYWGLAAADDQGGPRAVDWLSGAFLLLRREAFEQIGGFDEQYFMFFEDVDIAQRLANAGWTRVYVPKASVLHHGAHSTRRFASAMTRAHHESAYRYLSGQYPGLLWAPVRAALRVALRVRSAIAARV